MTSRASGESPAHRSVSAYIKEVDAIQQQMRDALTKTSQAYRDFATGKISAASAPPLVRAEDTLRTLQKRIAALDAPPAAARLRALLLQFTHAEVSLAGEVTQLAVFEPWFNTLLRQARAAGARLSRALAAAKPPTPRRLRGTKKQIAAAQAAFSAQVAQAAALQADAIDAYDARLAVIVTRLRALKPPPVLRPAFRAQLATLVASRRAGAALAQELRKASRSQVSALGRRFTLASRLASSVSAQEAEIAAVKAYDARVRALGTVQGRIRAELARLQRVTG